MKNNFFLLLIILFYSAKIRAMYSSGAEQGYCSSVIRVIQGNDYQEYHCYGFNECYSNKDACGRLNQYFSRNKDSQTIDQDSVKILSQSIFKGVIDQDATPPNLMHSYCQKNIFVHVKEVALLKKLKFRRMRLDYNDGQLRFVQGEDGVEGRILDRTAHSFFSQQYLKDGDNKDIRLLRGIKKGLDNYYSPEDKNLKDKVYFVLYLTDVIDCRVGCGRLFLFNLFSSEVYNKVIDHYGNGAPDGDEACVVEISTEALDSWYFDSYGELIWRWIKKPYIMVPCVLLLWYYLGSKYG